MSDLPLLNPTTLNRPEVSNMLLPIGKEENNYKVQIIARIFNKYGVYAEWIDSVYVKDFKLDNFSSYKTDYDIKYRDRTKMERLGNS